MKTRLIIVGGFLGAGKTTLLWESARRLSADGHKVGLITNDQASELVDTAFLEYTDSTVQEVSGSCFCCNFNGFSEAITKISEEDQCGIIIAEPVGSCTDLSATILQPLKEKFSDNTLISPLSVLIDPDRLSAIIEGGTSGLHQSAAYIVRKQLEEADLILISKSDLPEPKELQRLKQETAAEFPLAQIYAISSKTGEGLEEWLTEVTRRNDAGTHLVDVDYDTYAEGEAVLGWYNASFRLQGDETNWNSFLSTLMHAMSVRFKRSNAAVGHIKTLIQFEDQYLISNMTGIANTITTRGDIENSSEVKMTINARVEMSPEELADSIAEEIIKACQYKIKVEVLASKCLSPGRPNPTYRYSEIKKV